MQLAVIATFGTVLLMLALGFAYVVYRVVRD